MSQKTLNYACLIMCVFGQEYLLKKMKEYTDAFIAVRVENGFTNEITDIY